MYHFFTEYPNNRKNIRIFKSANRTTYVVNYCADCNALNSFIAPFDIWNSNGQFKPSDDGNYQEVWFEAEAEFYDFAHSDLFRNAMRRNGITIFYDSEGIDV